MNHSTRHHLARDNTQRFHTDPTFDRVLAIFVEQRDVQLSPSYIAYEIDLTSGEAEQLLDEMVKRSLLELDFDDNGQLYYSLSQDVRFELEQHAARAHTAPASRQPGQRTTQGIDGTIGEGRTYGEPPRPGERPRQRRSQPAPVDDRGCDGTVGHPSDLPHRPARPRGQVHDRQAPFQPAQAGGAPMARRSEPRSATAGRRPRGADDSAAGGHGEMVRRQSNLPARRSIQPMIAGLLSILLVGAGQIYNREVGKGMAFFVIYAVLVTTFFPMGWILNVWAAVDAYTIARRRAQ